MLQVTEVQIIPISPLNSLLGFAKVVLNDSLVLKSIAIHKKLTGTGFRLTYPTKKVESFEVTLFHPISTELSLAIEEAIFTKMKEVIKNDRHSSFNA